MLEPAVPHDESERLSSLMCLSILDTPAEERFDRITRMAQRLFGVKTCLVSLVDSQRQWFKSKQGLDAPETPRNISFCGHATLKQDIFVVTDATKDERFLDNPLVTEQPNIRFYAGCPLTGPYGYRVGTLCVIDGSPREMSDDDCDSLRDLAAMVEDEFKATAQATVDDLTKVANRRGFHVVANHMLALCRRMKTNAEVLFFDLDGFKQINDTHGHAAGDDMLVHFADLLAHCFRNADVVARLGGDEFVVLMTASQGSSDIALERLKTLAAEEQCEILTKLAWSAGSIQFDPERHNSVEALLEDADKSMYDDKAQRRLSNG